MLILNKRGTLQEPVENLRGKGNKTQTIRMCHPQESNLQPNMWDSVVKRKPGFTTTPPLTYVFSHYTNFLCVGFFFLLLICREQNQKFVCDAQNGRTLWKPTDKTRTGMNSLQ